MLLNFTWHLLLQQTLLYCNIESVVVKTKTSCLRNGILGFESQVEQNEVVCLSPHPCSAPHPAPCSCPWPPVKHTVSKLSPTPMKVQALPLFSASACIFTQLMWFLIFLKVTKSNTNPDDLGGFANQLTNEFGNLANEAKYAAITAENDEVNKTSRASAFCLLRDTSQTMPALRV